MPDSSVVFSAEQVKEIRRRIEAALPTGVAHLTVEAYRRDDCKRLLAAFPLPKVLRYRTFARCGYPHRVRDGVVEYEGRHGWAPNILLTTGDAKVESWAAFLARDAEWTALAALADVAARPTEEIDA